MGRIGLGNPGLGVRLSLGGLPLFSSFGQPPPVSFGFFGFPYLSTFHLVDTSSLIHFDSLDGYCTFIQYSPSWQVSMALMGKPRPVHFVLFDATGKVDDGVSSISR